jgi:hypothetical protein
VRRLAALLPALVLTLTLGACGYDGRVTVSDEPASALRPTEVPGDADAADVELIDAWATALTAGEIDTAARFFAIPSVAENGPLLQIENLDQARLFNAALPCGAELIRATREGDFTVATFRLRERPGPGICGDGTGETAMTAFVIVGHKIVEWRRVGAGGVRAPSRAT